MGKFALRGLAQSMYKELSIIDGAVREATGDPEKDSNMFTADSIAQSYVAVLAQPPGAWSWEIELRSKDEKF